MYLLLHRFFLPLRAKPPSKRSRFVLQPPVVGRHNHLMQLLRMIGIIAGTAGTITITVQVHSRNS
ncbi:MAG TPA: hypothetical protein VJW94_05160 [Candidatus Acidoferrum sp.]|nr:hypothetical protein [Candidatus Acidoferrum sp.]